MAAIVLPVRCTALSIGGSLAARRSCAVAGPVATIDGDLAVGYCREGRVHWKDDDC